MIDRREIFRLVGGPDAVTWPALGIVYLLSVAGHLATGGAVHTPVWERFIFVTIATVAMCIPLVILRFTLLRNPERPHPWIAIGGFAVSATVRAVVLAFCFAQFGNGDAPMWGYRIFSAILSVVPVLFLVALATASIHAHRPVLARLAGLQRDLLSAEREAEGVVAERNEAAVVRVRTELERELIALEHASSADAVSALQRTATDVVRPLSHELANAMPTVEDSARLVDPVVPWRAVVDRLFGGPSLWPLPSAVMAVLLLTPLALAYTGAYVLVVMVTAFAITWLATLAANALLSAVQPRLAFSARVITFILVIIAAALVEGTVMQVIVGLRATGFQISAASLFYMPLITVLAAIYASIRHQQEEVETAIEESTIALRRRLARTKQAQWFQQKALSRALHGPVQAAVVSAALRLDTAVQQGPVPPVVIDEVRRELLEVLDVLGAAEPEVLDFVASMERVQGTWSGLCEVAVIDTAESNRVLESDVILRSAVVDILTDSVSNAVRHGQAKVVDMAVSLNDSGDLVLRVVDNGTSPATSGSVGLGSRLLDDCALEWQRAESAHGHEVRAVLPVAR